MFRWALQNCNSMDYKIFLEWNEQSGILVSKTYPLIDGIENAFENKNYGSSISKINIVMTCMARDFKQRKQFKRDIKKFSYDILLDYYLNRNVIMEEKKNIIRRQIIEITEQTFSKYKFVYFDNAAFLSDLKNIVNSIEW
jgi:hypothetical protein